MRPTREFSPQCIEDITSRRLRGESLDSISARYGVSRFVMRNKLIELHVAKTQKPISGMEARLSGSRDEVQEMLNSGEAISEIADYFNVSAIGLEEIVRKWGFERAPLPAGHSITWGAIALASHDTHFLA